MDRIARFVSLLAVSALACFSAPAEAVTLIDPTGDTFGTGPVQIDIASAAATFTAADITFLFTFAGPIAPASAFAPNSVTGYIDLDTDQNPGTGIPPFQGTFGPPPAPLLGSDFYIDLFSEAFHPGVVDVVSTVTLTLTGVAPIMAGRMSFNITVPLALLSGDDGLLNYGAVLGTISEPTDEVPNGAEPGMSMPATATVIPEPGTLSLLGLGVASLVGARRRARRQEAA